MLLNKALTFKTFKSRFSCCSVTRWWHLSIKSSFYLPRSSVRGLVESSFMKVLWSVAVRDMFTWDKVQQYCRFATLPLISDFHPRWGLEWGWGEDEKHRAKGWK